MTCHQIKISDLLWRELKHGFKNAAWNWPSGGKPMSITFSIQISYFLNACTRTPAIGAAILPPIFKPVTKLSSHLFFWASCVNACLGLRSCAMWSSYFFLASAKEASRSLVLRLSRSACFSAFSVSCFWNSAWSLETETGTETLD